MSKSATVESRLTANPVLTLKGSLGGIGEYDRLDVFRPSVGVR
jgi:hypothetical protein